MASKKRFNVTLDGFGLQAYEDMPAREGIAYDVILTYNNKPITHIHDDGNGGAVYLDCIADSVTYIQALKAAQSTLRSILDTVHLVYSSNKTYLEYIYSDMFTDETTCFNALFELIFELDAGICHALGRKGVQGTVISCERNSLLAVMPQPALINTSGKILFYPGKQTNSLSREPPVTLCTDLYKADLNPVWCVDTEQGKLTYHLTAENIRTGMLAAWRLVYATYNRANRKSGV